MRHKLSSMTAFCALAAVLAGPLYAQAAKSSADEGQTAKSSADEGLNAPPCKQLESACKTAGFVQGGEGEGKGLWTQCFTPLMMGHPAPKTSKLPLPKVDEKVLAACRADNPNYGKGKPKTASPNTKE